MKLTEVETLTLELLRAKVDQIADTAADIAELNKAGADVSSCKRRLDRQLEGLRKFVDVHLPT